MRDLRRYARQTNFRLLVGFLLILLIVGEGLIYVIFGQQAAMLGLLCLALGLAPLLLIGLVLWGMDVLVKRGNQEHE